MSKPSPGEQALGHLKQHPDYVALVVVFIASRLALYLHGLDFNAETAWMFLADPEELRQQPLTTIYYFHAFPPGMNVHTAALLQFGKESFATLAHLSMAFFGLLQATSILYLAKALGIARWPATVLALAFSLAPPSLVFENLYIYTLPSAALLCAAAALFHTSIVTPSKARWFAFFAVACVLGWYRSTFHIVWFFLALAAGIGLCFRRRAFRQVLYGAALPGTVLLALYVKNLAVFGVFGATSWGGANLVAVTTRQMPRKELAEWIVDGQLSPLAGISVFAPPQAYVRHIEQRSYPWPGTQRFDKPSNGAPNFNHGLYLQANPIRRKDSLYYLKNRTGDWLAVVFDKGVPQFFEPSTLWHPGERKGNSPHTGHHRALGAYETAYNAVVHRAIPGLAPFGLYALLPFVLIHGCWQGWVLLRSRGDPEQTAQASLVLFLAFQIVFVVSVSCLFTLGESARYRFLIEAPLWLLYAVSGRSLLLWLKARRRTQTERAAIP